MATTTDTNNYKFNHSMIRVKDPKASIKFYEFLGMSVVKHLQFPDAKFDLYFLSYDGPTALSHGNSTFDRQGVIELTHNYGTEDDPHTTRSTAATRSPTTASGTMKHIAFALDPDGYWVEIISRRRGSKGAEDPEEQGKGTDVGTYRMNHTMIRVKDAEKSLKFYQDVLGMKLFRTVEQSAAKFNLYFLGYPGSKGVPEDGFTADYEGLLELTWNYGTEKDENLSTMMGTRSRRALDIFVSISVDSLDAACSRFETLDANWKKRLTDGRMKNVAFLLDPDGYWVEIVQNERFSGQENF
ncbi:Lactoylglutathione lyase [Daldinia childiae]|uniref:Lactoylglutathione lyase n=1 Tax=Daldinia childiae TaxID=326645 RepID=UPI001444DE95|nr:Lactoylglutathione lyase [Daldinia childiae]KAF3061446.1 Lactoylglutathione lyase [Daldinia childiae]